ncbi:MAG TPA: 2-oxoacid:acceptor oxidoreductase subunit alpha [Desulfomicrobiaceae bacterium]|nr:2-oxoacid:acceptor oxidoreductase subunit alpha [Desulfomicrobiaceae bacterium]
MSDSIRNIVIAGEAGQGLVTIGQMLVKGLIRSGHEVVVTQGYHSRIRGGHNTFAVRYGAGPVHGPVREIDVLVALNRESVDLHAPDMADDGMMLGDEAVLESGPGRKSFALQELSGDAGYENVVALGVLGSVLGIRHEVLRQELEERFGAKSEKIRNENFQALDRARGAAQGVTLPFVPPQGRVPDENRAMVNGNEAIALGAMAAGVNFLSYYPMTPATSIVFPLLAHAQELKIVVEQVEDEISAVNMAVGASYGGATCLVPTSGGGFALMTEGVSLAGMTETPLCVVVAQRPGPATGLPTRTEQGDLNLVLYAGHGEFPRAVFAPGSIEECFRLTRLAVELAERVQGPVFLLTDQFLADSYRAVPVFEAGELSAPARALTAWEGDSPYFRYTVTETGVSARLAPCVTESLVVADSDEHSEDGHITEDHAVRVTMVDKRLRKERILDEAGLAPTVEGDPDPDVVLVCWGSSLGPVREALEALEQLGTSAALVHYAQVWPLVPVEQLAKRKGRRVVVVEGNATGQFADLLARKLERGFPERILRYDGLPFTARYILDRLDKGA